LHQFKNGAAGATGVEVGKSSLIMNQELCSIFCQPDYFRVHIVNKNPNLIIKYYISFL